MTLVDWLSAVRSTVAQIGARGERIGLPSAETTCCGRIVDLGTVHDTCTGCGAVDPETRGGGA